MACLGCERPVRVDRHSHIARAVRRVARLLRRPHRNGQLRRGVEVHAGGGDGAVDAVVAELRRVQRQREDVLRTGKQNDGAGSAKISPTRAKSACCLAGKQRSRFSQDQTDTSKVCLAGGTAAGEWCYLRQSAEEVRAVVLAAGGDAARQLLVLVHVREVADPDRLVAVVLPVDRGQCHVEDRP